MENKLEKNELFQSAHLMILNCYTIFSVILLGESLLLGWEKWALVLIVSAVVLSWTLHIKQRLDDSSRIWIYSILMMVTFFFYGIHETSSFDIAAVMLAVIMIYTMTGMKPLITLCQLSYYITFVFDIVVMISNDREFDSLVITRSLLHVALVTMGSWIARTIIDKWGKVLMRSSDEISALKEITTRLNDFLANISHEIRTPINAVIGLTGICIEKEENEEIRQNLNSVAAAGKRVSEQISDILDYSEIDMKRVSVNCEDYMLSSLLNDLIAELGSIMRSDIELIIDVDTSLPSVMSTDTFKLRKILWHLISNGIKYTKKGGVYVNITYVPRDYGINLCIEVTDTGIGMSKAEINRVYDQFYQADSGRTRSTSGLGLGLTIVNGFVRSLDGFLTIDSKPDKGTTVRVSIPQAVLDDTDCMSIEDSSDLCIGSYIRFEKFGDAHVREFYDSMIKHLVNGLHVRLHRADNMEILKNLAVGIRFSHVFIGIEEYREDPEFIESIAKKALVTIVAGEEYNPPAGSELRVIRKPFYGFSIVAALNTKKGESFDTEEQLYCPGVRVLVVDDEPMNLTVARGIFKRYQMVVETADSGREAIDLCRENDYDIIFMDHMMPGMDGIEAMKRIRNELSKDKRHSEVPFVALTANAVSSAKEMFMSEGFDGFVSKPVELIELERVLRKVLPKSMITTEMVENIPDSTGDGSSQMNDTAPGGYELLDELGVDTNSGLGYCQDDAGFYDTLLLEFANDAKEKMKKEEELLLTGDLKEYSIMLHALKSTSKLIGAEDLSEKARNLEFAAMDGNMEMVQKMHPDAMEDYMRLSETIMKVLGFHEGGNDVMAVNEEADEDEIMEFAPEEV